VAALNKLVPPYLVEPGSYYAGNPKVALYGQTILVPDARQDIELPSVSAESVFKADVKLVKGRLEILNGDIVTVAGRENLKQAITIRITTARGELIFHSLYGCDIAKLKGRGNNQINALLGAKYVESALLADDRIAKVNKVVVSPNGDALPVEVEALTATGHPINTTVTV